MTMNWKNTYTIKETGDVVYVASLQVFDDNKECSTAVYDPKLIEQYCIAQDSDEDHLFEEFMYNFNLVDQTFESACESIVGEPV